MADTVKAAVKPASLVEALSVVQGKLPEVRKSETAHVRSEKGSYTYSYADLAAVSKAVLPLLAEVGLAFLAKPTLVDGRFVLVYSLKHVSGDSEDGEYPLPTAGTPQQIGSAITYARRYVLSALVGVAGSDDDDGAAASASHGRPAEDPWETARPRVQPEREVYDANDPRAIRRRMHALFTRAGIGSDRTKRLKFASDVVGHPLDSSEDLTAPEVAAVIKALEAVSAEPKEEQPE